MVVDLDVISIPGECVNTISSFFEFMLECLELVFVFYFRNAAYVHRKSADESPFGPRRGAILEFCSHWT